MRIILATLVTIASLSVPIAQGADQQAPVRPFDFRSGTFVIGDNLAILNTSGSYSYIGASEAKRFLTEFYGNPPSVAEGVLGLITPSDIPLDAPGAYAIVIEFNDDGYVSDEDAAEIDYDDLLKQMQEGTKEGNTERQRQGFEPVELLGWAQKPRYDKATHKFFWAKRLRFGASPNEALNYSIRILGRQGVLNLNVIADMDILPVINERMSEILAMVDFKQGQTYAEYNPEVDKGAAYGLAGLVAGGILTKTGFFKALLVALLSFKKSLLVVLLAFKKGVAVVIFGGLAAAWGRIKRLFARKE